MGVGWLIGFLVLILHLSSFAFARHTHLPSNPALSLSQVPFPAWMVVVTPFLSSKLQKIGFETILSLSVYNVGVCSLTFSSVKRCETVLNILTFMFSYEMGHYTPHVLSTR